MKSVYLAGPIEGLSYDGSTGWRELAKLALAPELEVLNPMRNKGYLAGSKKVQGSYEDYALSCRKGIISRDRYDVQNCDVVLANLSGDKISIGTMVELGWADAYGKPVIAVLDANCAHWHPFVREIVSFPVESVGDAIKVVRAFLLDEELPCDVPSTQNSVANLPTAPIEVIRRSLPSGRPERIKYQRNRINRWSEPI